MSDKKLKRVSCPKCGYVSETEIVEALTMSSPELKALFSGKLNSFECTKCHSSFLVEENLVFRDSEPPFILYLMQPPEDGETGEMEEQVDVMATEVFMNENLQRPKVRLVFSRPDFIEKIAIHKLGFDDRLIEYAKLQLFRSIDELQLSRSKHRLLLDYSHCDDENMTFLIFDRELLKPVNAVQVPMNEFRALEKEIQTNNDILLELEAAFPGCYVSADRLL